MAKQQKESSNNEVSSKSENEHKECFIITPIGSLDSNTYIKAMGLIDAVIEPVLNEFKLTAMPANRIQELGSINKQLISRILNDDLVIANLTGLNANVMYELAVRHAKRKPVIIMAEVGTQLPFDISDQRSIFYFDNLAGVEKAKEELRKKIPLALNDASPDNPIYNAVESQSIINSFENVDPNSPWLAVMERLDKIENNTSSYLPLRDMYPNIELTDFKQSYKFEFLTEKKHRASIVGWFVNLLRAIGAEGGEGRGIGEIMTLNFITTPTKKKEIEASLWRQYPNLNWQIFSTK